MAQIRVKKIPRTGKEISPETIAELISFYFPAYKYHEAKKLPYRRALRMLKTARQENAKMMLDIANIVFAQNAKKSSARKNIIDKIKARING